MTKEEKQKAIDALKISAPVMAVTQEEFNDYIQTLNKVMDWLEQEPCVEDIEELPSVIPQEPFINKPCVSSGVCEHDKNKVLYKIRAEIENDWQLKKYPSSPFSCGLRRAIEIIDKYKAKTEVEDESTN